MMLKPLAKRLICFLLVTLFSLSVAFPVLADGETGTFIGLGPYAQVRGEFESDPVSYYAGTMKFELADGTVVPAFCTDLLHHVRSGDEFVVSDEVMPCATLWVLTHYPPELAGDANEMAARQAVIWYISDGFLPDNQTEIGQRAWEIIDQIPNDPCVANTAVVKISPASVVNVVGETQTFTVTVMQGGQPVLGKEVSLTSSVGTLSSDIVTTDEDGRATFTLFMGMAGTADIVASASMPLPVGTIFVGTDTNKQKLVLGQETNGLVHGDANATWTGEGSITAVSFADYNMDAAHSEGEPLLEGWEVALYKDGYLVDQALTNANGQVTFAGLSGEYQVVETLVSDWYATSETTWDVTVNEDTQTVYFGQLKLPVIVAHKFRDDDLDGVWDDSEPSLSGWELQLFRSDGSAVVGMRGETDERGQIVFSSDPNRNPPDVVAGPYIVQETLTDGWYATTGITQEIRVGSGDVGHVMLGNVFPQPALSLSKVGPDYAHEEDVIEYVFAVDNTGNMPLDDVQISDPLLGGELSGCYIAELPAGETFTCEVSYTVPAGAGDSVNNTASVAAMQTHTEQQVVAEATHTVSLFHPAIEVQKSADEESIYEGATVVYTYEVTNPGDVPLGNITVSDDACDPLSFVGGDANEDGLLDIGEVWAYTCSDTPSETVTGVVTVTGEDALGKIVTGEDSLTMTVLELAPVRPILECVVDNQDGTYTAFFGYKNDNDFAVEIPVGGENKFTPLPQDRGQPTVFQPGRTPYWPEAAFSVVFDGNNLVWTLGTRTATASRNSTPCSNHVFIDKAWSGLGGMAFPVSVPDDFVIIAESSLGTATCTYADGSTELTCVYENDTPALDDNGLWVPVGSPYTITEQNLPAGWVSGDGFGVFSVEDGYCEPEDGGLSKYCTHTAQNQDVPPTASLNSSVAPTEVTEPGDDVDFTIEVVNTSAEPLTLVSLMDDIYGDLNGKGDCAVGGTIPVGESYTCGFSGEVLGNPGDAQTNTVTAILVDNADNEVVAGSSTTVVVTDALPAIRVSVSTNTAEVASPGESVLFTVLVENLSAEAVTLVSLSDSLLGDLDGQGSCAVGALMDVGSSYTCEFAADVVGDPEDVILNTILGDATDDEGNVAQDSDDVTVTVITDGVPSDDNENDNDTDGDGVPDFEDTDDDGDGIPDADEGDGDTDGDGTPDYQDQDSDGDGIPDVEEGDGDTDGDGTPDYQDSDADGDGIPDSIEGDGDTDGDGTPDYQDLDTDGDTIPDAIEGDGDTDGDGTPDYQDTDSDADGIPDVVEGADDTDGDGTPDFQDTDADNDGIRDEIEGDGDTDGDGTPDYLDLDSDGDGILDSVEGDRDTDGDGIPDFQDDDADGDGIPDAVEGDRDADGDELPNYRDLDSDGDGIPDDVEAGDDPTQPLDTDGDGMPDYLDLDADGDGIPDAVENVGDADNDGTPDPDADGDGVPNYIDTDSDGDGIPDSEEGTGDDDGDGVPNYLDPDEPLSIENDLNNFIYFPLMLGSH